MNEPKQDRFSGRPLGISLIGFTYAVLFGLQGLLGAARLIFSGAAQEEIRAAFVKLGLEFKQIPFHSILHGLTITQVFFSLVYLALGIGLLKRQEWARQVLLYFIIFAGLIALFVSILHAQFAFYMVVFLLYPAAVFWYLTKPGIKSWFRSR